MDLRIDEATIQRHLDALAQNGHMNQMILAAAECAFHGPEVQALIRSRVEAHLDRILERTFFAVAKQRMHYRVNKILDEIGDEKLTELLRNRVTP